MTSRRGLSLIELLVAVVLVEVAVITAFTAAWQVELITRRASGGAQTDAARWAAWHAASGAPSCLGATAPTLIPMTFPVTSTRPPIPAVILCGR